MNHVKSHLFDGRDNRFLPIGENTPIVCTVWKSGLAFAIHNLNVIVGIKNPMFLVQVFPILRPRDEQLYITNMGGGHTLRNRPVEDFAVVHMLFPQSRGHRNVEGVEEEEVLCHKGHHMDVEVEGNHLSVDVEEYAAHSHLDHSNPAEAAVGSVHDNAVEGCNHAEVHVYHIRPWEGILGAEGNEIDKGHDMGLAPQPVGPKSDEHLYREETRVNENVHQQRR